MREDLPHRLSATMVKMDMGEDRMVMAKINTVIKEDTPHRTSIMVDKVTITVEVAGKISNTRVELVVITIRINTSRAVTISSSMVEETVDTLKDRISDEVAAGTDIKGVVEITGATTKEDMQEDEILAALRSETITN